MQSDSTGGVRVIAFPDRRASVHTTRIDEDEAELERQAFWSIVADAASDALAVVSADNPALSTLRRFVHTTRRAGGLAAGLPGLLQRTPSTQRRRLHERKPRCH